MGTVYTDVLVSHHGLADGDTLTYDVPDGKRVVVLTIDAAAGASSDLPFLHWEDLVTGGTIAILAVGGLFLESVQWKGEQAFNTGGGFTLTAENNSWDVRVTGWLLTLP